jgi:ribosome modulation factor
MNRCLTFSLAISITLSTLAIPLRAANKPRAGTDSPNTVVWTNDDLERLHVLGLICIVGRMNEETPKPASQPQAYGKTRDRGWYAEQAAKLRDELERRQAHLGGYRQAIEDARSLKTMTGGINLDDGDIGITPEAGIEILRQRVNEAQAELDALEDLARRNDIPPGTLRGQ